ncbi:hypothetical protein AZI86_03555 [Bdellovibrio bacteriovorus]|uniref:DUF4142 domain-containing protein n=1 Tax=Bdellovibrio bacteriovorus TaxID=959 RepID=A0A150WP01_BDEBC|nr:DUF4142 domain-containing protein [Bdellovibrio bacteriovorus]KYG66150.1 hypothetical protein AZI86_03555 [Bdellovibrio bacteriovorus]
MKSLKLAALPLVLSAFMFGGFAHAANLSDQEVGEILKTVNDAEIDAAKAAKSRASNSEVKTFAKDMENAHENNNKEAKKVFKKADIDPKNNDIAKNLKKDAKDKLAELKKKKGSDFDKAYIENQIMMHQQVLNDLEQKYIPATQNSDFRAFLETTKTHVQEHLSKAQQIQSTLK